MYTAWPLKKSPLGFLFHIDNGMIPGAHIVKRVVQDNETFSHIDRQQSPDFIQVHIDIIGWYRHPEIMWRYQYFALMWLILFSWQFLWISPKEKAIFCIKVFKSAPTFYKTDFYMLHKRPGSKLEQGNTSVMLGYIFFKKTDWKCWAL